MYNGQNVKQGRCNEGRYDHVLHKAVGNTERFEITITSTIVFLGKLLFWSSVIQS